RATGQPVFPVQERPVPQTDVPGERTSPTQPFPTHPGPLVPQGLTADQVWGASDADRDWCRAEFARVRSDGMFTPPSVQGSLAFPGHIGGMHWGGVAFDPHRERVIVNTNRLAMIVRLIPRDKESDAPNDPLNNRLGGEFGRQAGTPFAMFRYPFLTPGRVAGDADDVPRGWPAVRGDCRRWGWEAAGDEDRRCGGGVRATGDHEAPEVIGEGGQPRADQATAEDGQRRGGQYFQPGNPRRHDKSRSFMPYPHRPNAG
ncbi:MAG: hypothetical protein ACRDTJ_08620, partial [Pseudonocardiaceae bacterium]